MTEIEKIAYAKTFIDKLANGINPLDDTILPEDDVVNNIHLSRCLFYVSDILRQVYENGGVKKNNLKPKSSPKIPFSLTSEQIEKIEYTDEWLSATRLAKKIYLAAENSEMAKFSYKQINQWLLNIGMLEWNVLDNGKMRRIPTAEGEAVGISMQYRRTGYGKMYAVVLYSKEAQRFIVDNIEAVLSVPQSESIYDLPMQDDPDDYEENPLTEEEIENCSED